MKHILGAAALAVLAAAGLAACGKKEAALEGTYAAGTWGGEQFYTFTGDGAVTTRVSMVGVVVYEQTGTYELSEDGAAITLVFPSQTEQAAESYAETYGLPFAQGMTDIGGVFTFSQQEDSICIGTVWYEKQAEADG